MSGGPYGPRGVLSDFGGGEGGSPNRLIGQTLNAAKFGKNMKFGQNSAKRDKDLEGGQARGKR